MGIIFLVGHPRKDPDTRSISVVGQAVEAVEAVEDVAPISKVHPAACPESSQLPNTQTCEQPCPKSSAKNFVKAGKVFW